MNRKTFGNVFLGVFLGWFLCFGTLYRSDPRNEARAQPGAGVDSQILLFRDAITKLNGQRLVQEFAYTGIDGDKGWDGYGHQHQMQNAVTDYMVVWHNVITDQLSRVTPPMGLKDPAPQASRKPYPHHH